MAVPSLSRPQILAHFGSQIFPESLSFVDDRIYFILRQPGEKVLGILAPAAGSYDAAFHGSSAEFGRGWALRLCPLDIANARALLAIFPGLRPAPLGLETSAGMGDRLGLATPGHARSLVSTLSQFPGRKIAPIFAQQSVRENTRTGRTPAQVLADATWGAFQAGWQGPVGADADHLKAVSDLDAFVEAGYSLFTIDPGEFVDSTADTAQGPDLLRKVEALPWDALESSVSDLSRKYLGKRFDLDGRTLVMGKDDILRAAAKYGRAVAHVVRLYRQIVSKGFPFELEVSVDETDTPTRLVEHIYVAGELKRLGVRWISLAPRFVGRFEKGVDYVGDLEELRADLQGHAAIARLLGPYKLSLHTGSDKFSVYPLAAEACRGLVHLKTAGTSYLEALRVLASADPVLFRRILALARARYAEDRRTYHVSAHIEKVPEPDQLSDRDLPSLLDQFDARQVLHVTFGSALDAFRGDLLAALRENEALYYQALEKHFDRHLRPFLV